LISFGLKKKNKHSFILNVFFLNILLVTIPALLKL
jgi:hypothetical protein